MSNQNFVSNKMLARYTLRRVTKTALICVAPIMLCFFIILGAQGVLKMDISSKQKMSDSIMVEKQKYENMNDEIAVLQQELNQNSDQIQYEESLKTKFSNFDMIMNYLISKKPADITVLSIEDYSLVPTSNASNVLNVSDANNSSSVANPAATVGSANAAEAATDNENATKESSEAEDKAKLKELDKAKAGSDTALDPTLDLAEASAIDAKYSASLVYSADIGGRSLLIRGYAKDPADISKYVTSIANVPGSNGFTIEGAEEKQTGINDLSVILFELKLNLKEGGQESTTPLLK